MQEYRRERILIADDSARNRRTLRELLEADFDIVTAAGGQQAVELLRLHHEEIDLVLLDIAMAENGGLKIGKVTDFQCHMIEHQLGAYTNCNHGAGLAVIHPILYRHIYKSGAARFARFAQNVWGVAPKGSIEETAAAGIDALAAFIKEIGLPTSFAELGIPDDTDFRAIADSTVLTPGCCKKLSHDEIYEILKECR